MPCMGPTGCKALMELIADKLFEKEIKVEEKNCSALWKQIENAIAEGFHHYFLTEKPRFEGHRHREMFVIILTILRTLPQPTKERFLEHLFQIELEIECYDF